VFFKSEKHVKYV